MFLLRSALSLNKKGRLAVLPALIDVIRSLGNFTLEFGNSFPGKIA
jgi:hypothetical protein